MVAHDPILADVVLGAAVCTPALSKLFGFVITADSPGSLCIVYWKSGRRRKRAGREKIAPLYVSAKDRNIFFS